MFKKIKKLSVDVILNHVKFLLCEYFEIVSYEMKKKNLIY